jgi:hypothetical protein
LQLSLLFFKTTPVLKIFPPEPDGMPLIEAWRLKIIKYLTSALKALVGRKSVFEQVGEGCF